jgi:hypothetical protein
MLLPVKSAGRVSRGPDDRLEPRNIPVLSNGYRGMTVSGVLFLQSKGKERDFMIRFRSSVRQISGGICGADGPADRFDGNHGAFPSPAHSK